MEKSGRGMNLWQVHIWSFSHSAHSWVMGKLVLFADHCISAFLYLSRALTKTPMARVSDPEQFNRPSPPSIVLGHRRTFQVRVRRGGETPYWADDVSPPRLSEACKRGMKRCSGQPNASLSPPPSTGPATKSTGLAKIYPLALPERGLRSLPC